MQKVYRKVNPTLSHIEKNKTLYRKTRSFMEDLYLNRLNLPPQFLKGRELLEFGSGTGEYSLSYVQWGLKCTFVEKNPFAAKRSKYLFNKLYGLIRRIGLPRIDLEQSCPVGGPDQSRAAPAAARPPV